MAMRTIRTCLFAVILFVFSVASARASEMQIFELLIVGEPILSIDDKDSMSKAEKDLHSKKKPPANYNHVESKGDTKRVVDKSADMDNTIDEMSHRVNILKAWVALSLNAGKGGVYFMLPF